MNFSLFKLVLEDLFQPSAFCASHQYSPWSCGPTDSNVNSEIPFTLLMFSLGTGSPSLYHVTAGLGMPFASQARFTVLPAETFI